MSRNQKVILLGVVVLTALFPSVGFASVESTLQAFQTKIIGTVLPLAAIMGLLCATFSFFCGNANAKQHVILAIIGSIIGFGAPSIIAFIRQLVH